MRQDRHFPPHFKLTSCGKYASTRRTLRENQAKTLQSKKDPECKEIVFFVSHFHLTDWEIIELAEEGLYVMPDGTLNGYYIMDLESVQLEIKILFRNCNFNRNDKPQLMFTIRPRRFFPMIKNNYFDLGPYQHPQLQNPNPKPTTKIGTPSWMFFVLLGLILSLCAMGYCFNQRTKRRMGTDYYSIILDEQINRRSGFSSREVGLEV